MTTTADGMLGSLSTVSIRNPLRRGQQVTLPAGTALTSTNPRKRGVQVLKRAQRVTLHTVNDGYIDLWNDAGKGIGFVWLPGLTWIGSGDYYMDAKVTPELAEALGVAPLRLPTLSEYDRRHLDVEPCFGSGYDNRDA